jgi:SanA protein
MKKDLMNMGVSEDKIFLDYAGFRTLDSILRAKEIFSQNEILIVSQDFHLERALAIAKLNNIKASGFSAKSPPF